MAKGDAPPRRRLVASDSEDEAPPAPPAPDPPPDPDSDASPEVNWASVAQRLRYVVPAPPDPSADLDPDAHALITDALSELRALDFVARDPAEVAAKLVEHDVLDAVFALLRDAPPPASSDDADPASDDASDDKENAAAAAASTAPDPTPEALKRARRIAMLRAKHAAVTLPALRALAHLLGAPGPIRRDVGSALLRVRTVFAHLDPRRGDPSNAILEAALRALASVAVSSASAASRIALMCAGKDEAFPDGARWFVDRFAAFEPGKRRNAAAPSARVGAKAARLATLLLKTPANRAAMFGAWSEGAAAEDLEDSADAEPEPSAEASKSSEVVRRRPDLLAAAFRLYAESRGDPDARRRRRLEEAAKEARGASKGDPDPSAPDEAPVDADAPFSDPGDDPSTRVFCLRIVAQACADADGDARVRVLDPSEPFDGVATLALATLCEDAPAARRVAADALRRVVESDSGTARRLGERDFVRALTTALPNVSAEPPELVVPPDPDEPDEGEDDAAEGEGEAGADTGAGAGGGDPEPGTTASSSPERGERGSVSGHNVFTEAFGVRAVGYVSPPPRPRGWRPAGPDAFTADPFASSIVPIATAEDQRLCFPALLRVLAAVLANDASSRRVVSGAISWVVAYLDKVGDVDVRAPMDLREEDLETLLAYLARALRPAAEAPPDTPPPEPEKTPEEIEAEAAREAARARAEAKRDARARRRRVEMDETIETEEEASEASEASEGEGEASEEESPEAIEKRLAREKRTRDAARARRASDLALHNPETTAAVFATLESLASEPGVCRAICSPVIHPGLLERVIVAASSSFATIEEAARFLVRVGERGAHPRVPFSVPEELASRGLVAQLERVARTVRTDPPDVANRVAVKMAHETAVMLFPTETYLPPERPFDPEKPTYATTPPRPRAPPVASWRRRATRNVDDRKVPPAESRSAAGPGTEPFDRTSTELRTRFTSSSAASRTLRLGGDVPYDVPGRPTEVLPLHAAVPDPWRFRDPDSGDCLRGRYLRDATLEVVGARVPPREPLVGFEDEPDSEEEAEREAARDTNAAQEDSEGLALDEARSRASEALEAATAASIAASDAADSLAEAERAESALFSHAAPPLPPPPAPVRGEDGVPGLSVSERAAMVREYEAHEGDRARARARREDARAAHAARALTASVLRSVAATEAERLEAAEAREHARRLNPPFDEAEWRAALDHLAADAPRTESGAVPSPPTIAFRVARFVLAVLAGDATFGTFDEEAIEAAAAAAEEGEGEGGGGAGDDANARPVGVPSLDPPTRRAVRERLEAALWADPEGAFKAAFREADPEKSLASRMAAFVLDELVPNESAGAASKVAAVDAVVRAAAAGLDRCYVRDADEDEECPEARAFAARALRWSRGVVAIVDARDAKARRAEARRARRAEAREERRRERRRARKERAEKAEGEAEAGE